MPTPPNPEHPLTTAAITGLITALLRLRASHDAQGMVLEKLAEKAGYPREQLDADLRKAANESFAESLERIEDMSPEWAAYIDNRPLD